MIFGNPNFVKNPINSSTIFGLLILLTGIASGYFDILSIKVNRYSWPLLVLGSGPTMSIITSWKGSFTTGIGIRGAFGIT